MKMRPMHWFASLLLLLVFLGSKALEYHSVAHRDEDRVACEYCDFALLLQTTPFEPAPESAPEIPGPLCETGQAEFNYSFAYASSEPGFRNFCRPPPALS